MKKRFILILLVAVGLVGAADGSKLPHGALRKDNKRNDKVSRSRIFDIPVIR